MIIGVDPGKMTGLWFMIDTQHCFGHELPAMEALDEIERVLQLWNTDIRPVTFAVERYDIGGFTTKMSRQPDALEVIGAVKFIAHKLDGEQAHVVMQARSSKTRVTDVVLRRLEWWKRGTAGHMHDAQRHALICAATLTPWHEIVQQAFGTIE